ncbi:MAG: radical SAM protein [Pseudomonadota bacterium]
MHPEELRNGPRRRIALINPPVIALDRVQVDYYADAIPHGLFQIATWLSDLGHEVRVADMMSYEKHRRRWRDLLVSGDLTPVAPVATGAPGHRLDAWRYGQPLDALEPWFKRLGGAPDEVWVTCAIPFNGEVAHGVIEAVRALAPAALIRFGGGYPSALPEEAAASGADDVHIGRVRDADRVQPDLARHTRVRDFAHFRLTCGCPNRCTFCINGSDDLHRFDVGEVLEYIRRTRRDLGITRFNNWDPNVLQFGDHLRDFLDGAASLPDDVRLRFDMGLEPALVDDLTGAALRRGRVSAFSIPFESVDPDRWRLYEKPYTVISTLRALGRLRDCGFDLSPCHGTYIIGFPDEDLRDLFAVHHLIHGAGLLGTPFPITPVKGSPIWDRYADRLDGRATRDLNGHAFPLLGDADTVALYRRLLPVLVTTTPGGDEALMKDFSPAVREAWAEGRARAARLVEAVRRTAEPDSIALLEQLLG